MRDGNEPIGDAGQRGDDDDGRLVVVVRLRLRLPANEIYQPNDCVGIGDRRAAEFHHDAAVAARDRHARGLAAWARLTASAKAAAVRRPPSADAMAVR